MSLSVWQRNIVNTAGDVVGSASVEVRRESDSALATLYDNPDGTGSPLANPVTADAFGFVRFYTAAGAYRIVATSGAFSATWRHVAFGDAQQYRVGTAADADLPTRADADARYLQQSQNLADLDDASAARAALGLGTAAVLDEGTDGGDLPTVATVETIVGALAQPVDADLTAIAGLGSVGLLTRTGAGTWALRTLEVADRLAISNADGVAGNPALDLAALTADRALVTDGDGYPAVSATLASELGNLAGSVAPLQAQFNGAASTGLRSGGVITINADPTKFDVSAISAVFVTQASPAATPVLSYVTTGAFTAVAVTNIGTQLITYIALGSDGQLYQFANPLTPQQRRDYVELGAVVHSNLTTINAVNPIVQSGLQSVAQLHDLMNFLGPLNLTGNKYTANGANLNLNVSAGTVFKFGCNFQTDHKDPHRVSLSAGTAITFRYRTQLGAEGSDVTAIDPNTYDNGGVLTTVPNGRFTVQLITRFQSGLTRIQYGQTHYGSMNAAIEGMQTDPFVVESNIAENGIIRSWLVVQKNTTSLSNTNDAQFFEVPKFGGAVANPGGALTDDNIIAALGYTPQAAGANVAITGAAATNRELAFQTSAVNRWIFRTNSTAESGSNAGSDLQILARDDAGAALWDAVTITRSNGFFGIGGTAATKFQVTQAGALQGRFYNTTHGTDLRLVADTDHGGVKLDNAGMPLLFSLGGSEAARFAATTRNLLINTTTDNGSDKLQVNGSGLFSGNGLTIDSSGAGGSTSLNLTCLNTGSSTINFGGTSNPDKGRISYSDNSDIMQFFTNDSEKVRITATGNLLIGTTTDDGINKLQVNGNGIRIATAQTPASATAAGTTGTIAWDTSYIYVCTATNTWKRAAIATW